MISKMWGRRKVSDSEFDSRLRVLRSKFEGERTTLYLDNAATTAIDPEVVQAMGRHNLMAKNASAVHINGLDGADCVWEGIERVAESIGAEDRDIYFTSGGTESNNWALKGVVAKTGKGGLVIGAGEHQSISKCAHWMNGGMAELSIAGLLPDGRVDMDSLKGCLENGAVGLVSIQHSNSDTGVINDIPAISELVHKAGALLHVDAVQSWGKVELNVGKLGVDLMTLSGHKIHGPQGIGVLYIRDGVEIEPLIHGGGQQRGKRAGTLPVQLIVGLGVAAAQARVDVKMNMDVVRDSQYFMECLLRDRFGAKIAGDGSDRLPTISKIILGGDVEADMVCALLSQDGIMVSVGSACDSVNSGSSLVLRAMGYNEVEARSAFRVSLCRGTTRRDVLGLVDGLGRALRRVREQGLI